MESETAQSTYIGGDLGEKAKNALIKTVDATSAPNNLECLRQICLQIEREMTRKNLTSFTFGDIQILVVAQVESFERL